MGRQNKVKISRSTTINKIIVFLKIYGIRRTLYKILGRLNLRFRLPALRRGSGKIVIIGCGQYSFATIQYVLDKNGLRSKGWVYDIDEDKAKKMSTFFGYRVAASIEEIPEAECGDVVFIASYHSSHIVYSEYFLSRGYKVYSEKPAVVSMDQLNKLEELLHRYPNNYYIGYNRPQSPHIVKAIDVLGCVTSFTLTASVNAHVLDKGHWYRNALEGTRICGNVGHWLDLYVYLLFKRRKIPTDHEISIAYSNPEESDDNISISITSDQGDLFSFSITSRVELIDGINEIITYSASSGVAVIEDFRKMTLRTPERLWKYSPMFKDVGHENTIMQPFNKIRVREPSEILASASLVIEIMRMVRRLDKIKLLKYDSTASKFK